MKVLISSRFLIAQLHMDSLAKKQNKRDIRQGYENLPKEINGTYDEAMKRISSQVDEDVQLAKQVLSWLLYAQRPLTVTELQHALATEPEARALDEEALPDEGLLVSICAGLVVIENESSIIRLVHYTTQEYLERVQISLFPTAKIDIAITCLTYLMFDHYSSISDMTVAWSWLRMTEALCESGLNESHPLLHYAIPYWATHTRGKTEQDPRVQRLVFQLLRNECRTVKLFRVMPLVKHLQYIASQHMSPLFTVASSVLRDIAIMLIDRGALPDGTVEDLAALYCTAATGSADVSKMLLKRGALVDQKTLYNATALHFAAIEGHYEVARHLLEFGAIVDAADADGQTPLFEAARLGDRDVVRLLLEAGADVNMEGGDGLTPLSCAAWHGHISVPQLLLEARPEVNAQDYRQRTPLMKAAQGRSIEMVQLLIEAGADINVRDKYGSTALQYAVMHAHISVVQLLIEVGVDVNAETCEGKTPLDTAVEENFGSIIQLLMDAGAKTGNQVRNDVESGQNDHAASLA